MLLHSGNNRLIPLICAIQGETKKAAPGCEEFVFVVCDDSLRLRRSPQMFAAINATSLEGAERVVWSCHPRTNSHKILHFTSPVYGWAIEHSHRKKHDDIQGCTCSSKFCS